MARRDYGEAGRPNPQSLVQESDERETGGGKDETLKVTLLGNTLPVPRWTLSWIGVLVLMAMAAVIARHIGLDIQNVSWSEEAKKQMEFANQEYGRHPRDRSRRGMAKRAGARCRCGASGRTAARTSR